MKKSIDRMAEEVISNGVKKIKEELEKIYENEFEKEKEELKKRHQEEVKLLKEELEQVRKKLEESEKQLKRKVDDEADRSEENIDGEKNNGRKEEEKAGFLKEYTRQKWRYDLEYRKRLIRVTKGEKYEGAKKKVGEWLLEKLDEQEKDSVILVRKEKNSVWFECKDMKIKEIIWRERRKIKEEGWYKIEDVMLEIERLRKYKVEEYANSRKVLGSKIRTIWDKVEIDGAIYGWNEKRSEIYKV